MPDYADPAFSSWAWDSGSLVPGHVLALSRVGLQQAQDLPLVAQSTWQEKVFSQGSLRRR